MANATPNSTASETLQTDAETAKTGEAAQSEAKSVAAAEPAKQSALPAKPVAKAPAKRAAKKTTGQSKARKPSPPRKYSGDKSMTATKNTAKDTIETMTTASNEALKDGFEKSMNAVNEFSAFHKDSVDAVIASSTTAAKSMAGAKSVQELIEIQSDYTKSSMDALLAEMNKSSDLMSSLFKDSFKPINERFSAALELMQSQR